MDLVTTGMMLVAALMHSSWHALVKTSGDGLTRIAGMNVVSAGAASLMLAFVPLPPVQVWPVLLASVVLQSTYKVSLVHAYRNADLGHSYPMARGFAPLFAALIAWLSLGEAPSPGQVTGIAAVSAGLLLLSLEALRRRPSARTLVFVAVAGLMVACYSVTNGLGTRLAADWLSFAVWLLFIDGTAFVAAVCVLRGREFWLHTRTHWRGTALSGLFGLLSYGIFLWALSRAPVASVAAVRETSVLFAYLIGILFLKEPFSGLRLVGCGVIVAGVAAISLA